MTGAPSSRIRRCRLQWSVGSLLTFVTVVCLLLVIPRGVKAIRVAKLSCFHGQDTRRLSHENLRKFDVLLKHVLPQSGNGLEFLAGGFDTWYVWSLQNGDLLIFEGAGPRSQRASGAARIWVVTMWGDLRYSTELSLGRGLECVDASFQNSNDACKILLRTDRMLHGPDIHLIEYTYLDRQASLERTADSRDFRRHYCKDSNTLKTIIGDLPQQPQESILHGRGL